MASEHCDHTGARYVTALESGAVCCCAPTRRGIGGNAVRRSSARYSKLRPAERTWPRPRDAYALIAGGLKARATENRHHTTAANLRAAVMVGIAVYLAVWVASYLSSVATEFGPTSPSPGWSAWPALLTGLLIAATVLLAWTAPPVVLLIGTLAAGAAVSYFALVRGHPVGPAATQLICLAALMTLALRGERPSRRWLWPVGLIVALALLLALGRGYGSGDFAPLRPPS